MCWGLEIGAASIKAIKLEAVDETRVKVLDFGVVQHPKVLSTPGVDANDVLRVSLGQLMSQFDFSKAGLAVSVPGQAAFARFTKLPPVEPKKVPDIVRFEAIQQIPFPLEEVEWDYQTFVSPDSPDVSVGIFAIRKDNVRDRLTLLNEVGLTPDVLTLSPLAVYNAIAYDLTLDDKAPGTIIVDVGTTSTDIVIAEPGRMWVRTFALGGHQFTDALVQQFQLTYPKAEKLKREAEDTKHARQVFQAMRPVFTDLATEVQRSIGYYQALHKDSKLVRLVGVGSTFRLPGLRKYLKQQLGLEVYRVEEFKKLAAPGSTAASDAKPAAPGEQAIDRNAAFHDSSLNLVTAYGLALQGLGMNACGGNLMPLSVVRESMWRDKAKFFAAAAGIAVAAGAAFFARPIYNYLQIKNNVPPAIIDQTVRAAEALKAEANAAGVTGGTPANYSAANILDLLKHRGVFAHLVNDVGTMFEKGDARLAQMGAPSGGEVKPPAFALVSFTTEYIAPTAAADPNQATPPPSGDASEAPPDFRSMPTLKCVLTVTTDAPEARRFAEDTLVKWLRENKERPGVPYLLSVNVPGFELTELAQASAPAAPTAPSVVPGIRPPAVGGSPGRGPVMTGDGPRLGPRVQDPRMPALPGVGPGVGPGGAPGSGPVSGEVIVNTQELDQLAPLPPDARAARRNQIKLTFFAGVPAPKKEGGST
jgi:type IV pilus assembly protein PilM